MKAGYEWLRQTLVPVAGALMLAACAGSGSSESSDASAGEPAVDRAAPATLRRTIVFVGTSLTAGMGLDPEQAFPAILEQKIDSVGLPYEVINAGNSGETSAGALRRIDWILRQPMDVLVLETGANDGLRGIRPDSVRANIQGIIDRVRASKPDTRIMLVQMEAPPNFGPRYTAEFRRIFPALAKENDVDLLPFLLDGVAGNAALNQADGMHPNVDGARAAAEILWRALQPILTDIADD